MCTLATGRGFSLTQAELLVRPVPVICVGSGLLEFGEFDPPCQPQQAMNKFICLGTAAQRFQWPWIQCSGHPTAPPVGTTGPATATAGLPSTDVLQSSSFPSL